MPRRYQPKYHADGSLNPKYKPRKRPSGKSGKRLTKFARGDFVAWDGEGWTRDDDGRHVYTMLCNSVDDAPLINLRGLPTIECLDYLCRIGEQYPKSIHVVFGGGYDVNMMLADCSRDQLAAIHRGEWVVLGRRYVVCYRARKSFTVKRWPTRKNIGGTWTRLATPGIVLWDVFGFFQSPFVDACEKYLGANYPGLAEVRYQKKRRRQFDPSHILDILHYCQLECSLLVSLMTMLREYMQTANLQVSRWDGAGACAASLLKREKILEHKGKFPDDVLRAAQRAYAGGRMELNRYGNTTDPVYHYDINSAYPTHMANVPSLAAGTWVRTRDGAVYDPARPFTLYRISWTFGDCDLFPFFWRAYDGSIYFPQHGSGVYWGPEIGAALDALNVGALDGTITIHESWAWYPDSDVKPFEWLPRLYDQRREWKRDGIGAEKVVKLAINSLYGKTAQHLGGTATDAPRYHQLEWAGFITSSTRAQLYRAAIPALKSRAIIMTATDALYSLQPLEVPCGAKLGEWESHTHHGITVVQSGVYWTRDRVLSGNRLRAHFSPFCRGFDRGSLRRADILRAWRSGHISYEAQLTRFVTMGSALAGAKNIRNWRQWRTVPRVLALTVDGTKRVDEIDPSEWTRRNNPAVKLMHTRAAIPAAQIAGQRWSAPFPLPWVDGGSRRIAEPELDGVPLRVIESEAYDATI